MASSPSKVPVKSPSVKSSGGSTPSGMRGRPSLNPTDLTLPTQRVKMIMKSCPDVETVSQDTLHLITRATELFIEYLAVESYKCAENKDRMDYESLSSLVHMAEHLEFLREAIPKKVTWAEAQKLIEENSNKFEGFF
ncbi:chromatin accessibility complex protein 1-like isoform X1 [Penaeus japonicus]|uniref:chromatin accessibility complex protein 1-like isoform X1 n=1 Tax=Penaeus japonicus TaxID=27405 RepID=UPI001C716979|nr:chromatin accessibility complex protein 1-like isoform X1 [Penaeus japonicus]